MASPTKYIVRFIVYLLVFSFVGSSFAQDKKTLLQTDKKKIEEEIEYSTRLLEETKKSKKTSLNQLVLLKKQIRDREKLLQNMQKQIKAVDETIKLDEEIITDLNADLKKLRDEYARMVYFAYKNRNSYDKLMFVFAANDFNQAYKRLKYFQQYSEYRKMQSELIVKTREELESTVEQLEQNKQEKMKLLSSLTKEKDKLNREKTMKSKTVRNLNKKEKQLLSTIKQKEKASKKLQKEIEKIIAEEIRLAARKSGTKKTSSFALTPAELQLSANFELNKNKLPWPLKRGVISENFGEHPHPVLKNVMVQNKGLDFLTDKGARARAVFNGEVTRVISIAGYNYVVMVRHGEFLTVYSNLVEVFVQNGDKVSTGQDIGEVHTDTKEMKTELHFEMWKGKTLLNPSNWLAR
ncbi:MAG: peptidoglycan DD-metalloendopeptidase family protein [Chlorobi bacterium]|nr:peptidoglycan DD-metalloendopeptidase family protein [Chlorobiota bacterium]